MPRQVTTFLALMALGATYAANAATSPSGACDGSAIVSLGAGYFLSATDDDNLLRLYSPAAPTDPVEISLNEFLKPERNRKGEYKEVDIEAVARVGELLYWIGSFGTDSKGNPEPSRERFFATHISGSGATLEVRPEGHFDSRLLDAVIALDANLGSALRDARRLAPKRGGISIEGMAPLANGSLLIGLRSPLIDGKALLVELRNPSEVIRGNPPRLEKPRLLDLGGLGVRALEATSDAGSLWILAGSADDGKATALFRWQPSAAQALQVQVVFPRGAGNPEGLALDRDSGKLYVSLDAGELGLPVCKDLSVQARRFTLTELQLPARPSK